MRRGCRDNTPPRMGRGCSRPSRGRKTPTAAYSRAAAEWTSARRRPLSQMARQPTRRARRASPKAPARLSARRRKPGHGLFSRSLWQKSATGRCAHYIICAAAPSCRQPRAATWGQHWSLHQRPAAAPRRAPRAATGGCATRCGSRREGRAASIRAQRTAGRSRSMSRLCPTGRS